MESALASAGTNEPVAGAMELRLSTSQRQLWFAEQLGGHPAGYLVSLLLRLQGPLHVPALRAALAQVVARHEVLRTSLQPENQASCGVLRPPEAFDLEVVPVSAAELRAVGGLEQVLRAEVSTPLDVTSELPIRARLLRLADEDHVLYLAVHHLAFDDLSRRVLYQELTELYQGYLDNRPATLAPPAVQYREFAAVQERRAAGSLPEHLAYWREQLAGLTPFELLPERPRPPRRSGQGGATGCTVPKAVTERLAALGRQHGATLAMVLFAACQAVLRHYTGRDDVTVGTTIATRDEPEAEALIGPLINTLILRGDTSGDPTFAELVERVRDLTLDALEHCDVPFGLLVEELEPERDLSRTPLYQIMIGYGGGSRPPRLPGLTVTELPVPGFASKWDMNVWFDHRPDGSLAVDIGWDSNLYHTQTMRRFADHLSGVLAAAAQRPLARIGDLQVVSAAEADAVRGFAVGPRFTYPAAGLHERFEQQAARTPGAAAVVGPDGTVLSYADLNAAANQVADRLRRMGVGPETLVGICAGRSLELMTGVLGTLKAGAGYLPLDPAYPAERTAFMVRDTAAPVILAQSHLRDALPATGATVLTLDDAATWTGCATANPLPLAGPDNIAYVIYTSGSTGVPKGAVLTHRAVVDRIEWMQRMHPLGADDAVLLKTPITFDVSVNELFWPLMVGARLVLARPGGEKDTRYLRDLIVAERVTVAQFVPSMLTVFVDEHGIEACTSLRLVVPGGEEVPLPTAARFVSRLPGCELHNGYGPTEAAIYANWWHCRPESLAELAAVPLGRPFGNTRTYVLDAQLRAVTPGAVGELFIGGTGLARAYLNRPDLTAERFLPDPFTPDPFTPEPGSRLYRTGDLVRLRPDGGSLEFLGRIDNQVKVRGFRIELGEIEAALCAHPAVGIAVAVLRDTGSGDRRLAAYLTAADGTGANPADLRAFLGTKLPAHAVPGEIVVLDTLPRLPSGKIDRRALATSMPADHGSGDSASGGGASGGRDGSDAPRTGVEDALAAIWADVVGAPRVGIHDNFFAIGGHSLSAIRAVNRMREWFEVDVPLSLLFEYPTIATLATEVERIVGTGTGTAAADLQVSGDRS